MVHIKDLLNQEGFRAPEWYVKPDIEKLRPELEKSAWGALHSKQWRKKALIYWFNTVWDPDRYLTGDLKLEMWKTALRCVVFQTRWIYLVAGECNAKFWPNMIH